MSDNDEGTPAEEAIRAMTEDQLRAAAQRGNRLARAILAGRTKAARKAARKAAKANRKKRK